MTKFFISSLIGLLLLSTQLLSQDSLSIKEAEQMKFRAHNLVADALQALYNTLASEGIETNDIKTLIESSYSGTNKKIFYNAESIIEDDIDPTVKNSTTAIDSKVSKYLGDFDILYTKSENASVIISNVRVSNPKRAAEKYIYVNVYYNSFFRNRNKTNSKAYTINNRVASVRMEMKENRWTPYINSITFFNPEDTLVNDYANDVPIIVPNTGNVAFASLTSPADSITRTNELRKIEEEVKEEELRKEKEAQKLLDENFSLFLEKGDQALATNQFTVANDFYTKAKALKPFDNTPQKRISASNRKKEDLSVNQEKIYQDYVRDAALETKKRNFEKAMTLYRRAVELKPETAAKHDADIKALESKWTIVYALQQKQEAGMKMKDLIDEYDAAIKKNKDNSDLYLGRGKCYELQNNYKRALEDYTQAYSLENSSNLAALKQRASFYRNNNKIPESITDYQIYLAKDDKDSSVYETVSELRLRINSSNIDGAIKDLDKGLEINNRWANLHYKKGLLQAEKKDMKGALVSFASTVKYDTAHALGYYHRGTTYLFFNDVANAALDFRAAREKGLDSVYIQSIEFYAKNFYDRALQKLNEPVKDSAGLLLDYAIAINPGNSEYRFTRGEYYLGRKNYHEAIKNFDAAIERNKNYTEAYYKRGLAYANLQDYKTAGESFSAAVALNKKHFDAQKGLADAHFAMKEYQQAADSYEGFIQIINSMKNASNAATIANAYNSMGKAYFKLNEGDERALNAFRNAVKKDANYAEALYNRGWYQYKKNQLGEAIADMQKAVSIDNKLAEWNYNLATAYRDKRDFHNAAVYYHATMTKDSLKKYPGALYSLANANYELQNYPTAINDYLKLQSLQMDSSIQSFNYELGNIYLNLNKPDSALLYLQKAAAKDSTNGSILYAIATAQLQKGKQDEALALFEKAFITKQVNQAIVKKDKLIANIREDKRFKALMKKYY